MNIVFMNVRLIAFELNVSSSRNRSLAVLSNTIIASASIAALVRNVVGNSMSASFLYCIAPKSIPASNSSSTSGILSLLPIQEHNTPVNSKNAIAVVIISASCIVCYLVGVYLNFSYH